MRRKGRLRSPFLFATCDRRHGAHPPVVLNILATDQLEGADVSGVISEGGERLTELYGADAPMVLCP